MASSPNPLQAVAHSRGLAETASRLLSQGARLRAASVWLTRGSVAAKPCNGKDTPMKVCRVGGSCDAAAQG
jgi:hypothetical protein